MPKRRFYLCDGCVYNAHPKRAVEDGQVNCEAKGEVLSAIEHTRGRRYETCPQRIGLAKKGDSTQEFLKELARRCRRAKPEDFDQIEQDLKKELSMNP